MSIATQELIFGVTGQSLVLTTDRPITSVTSVAVYEMTADDTSTAEAATTGSAAVDTATEATTAAAGASEADPRMMAVASTTGFVAGRRYLISKAGRSEEFEADRIDPNVAIYARHPLASSYASGATIDGTLRATIAVDPTWVADASNLSPSGGGDLDDRAGATVRRSGLDPNARYRVRWVVVHADTGETADHLRNLDLVRYSARPTVSPIDVNDAYPGWLDGLDADDRASRGRYMIAEAIKEVRFRLYGEGIADQAIRNAEVFADLVKAQAVYQAIEDQILRGANDGGRLDLAKAKVDAVFARLVKSPTLALDEYGGGAATTTTGRAMPMWRR